VSAAFNELIDAFITADLKGRGGDITSR
jgi:hypothetical protein